MSVIVKCGTNWHDLFLHREFSVKLSLSAPASFDGDYNYDGKDDGKDGSDGKVLRHCPLKPLFQYFLHTN